MNGNNLQFISFTISESVLIIILSTMLLLLLEIVYIFILKQIIIEKCFFIFDSIKIVYSAKLRITFIYYVGVALIVAPFYECGRNDD